MSTMLGDEVLRAAPANYVELEKVIAQYSNSASDEELRIARARLQTVAAADAALQKLAQHHGTIPQQRLAIEQHSSQQPTRRCRGRGGSCLCRGGDRRRTCFRARF